MTGLCLPAAQAPKKVAKAPAAAIKKTSAPAKPTNPLYEKRTRSFGAWGGGGGRRGAAMEGGRARATAARGDRRALRAREQAAVGAQHEW